MKGLPVICIVVFYLPSDKYRITPGIRSAYFTFFSQNLGLYPGSAYSRGRLISNFFLQNLNLLCQKVHILDILLHKHDFISKFSQKSRLIFEVGLFPGSAYLTFFSPKYRLIPGPAAPYSRGNTVYI